MRFPLGLAADLAIARARQILRGSLTNPTFLQLAIFAGSPNSPVPLASCECLSAVRDTSAPVVWIDGLESLLHPEIGRLARRIVDSGRHVFVTTDGALLHRRIHEFRPVSRLFLTVKFHGDEEKHDQRAGREGTFRDALNGIRTAKLSGFLVCAEISVYPGTEISELTQLREILAQRDVDGFIVRPARNFRRVECHPSENVKLKKTLHEAKAQIPGRRWKWFSRMLNDSLLAGRIADLAANHELGSLSASQAETREENVEVS